jgi:phosphatidylglycerol lysyltransferase
VDQGQRAPLSAAVRERLKKALPALIGLALFAAALAVLRRELAAVSWHELSQDVLAIPLAALVCAAGMTAINYLVLTGYDLLAFEYVGKRLPLRRIVAASLVAYAIANNVGFAALSGASVRYRFYTRWGVTNAELTRIVFAYSVTFWLGLFALGGVALALGPLPSAHDLPGSALVASAGWLLILACAAYLVAAAARRTPLRFVGFELPFPSFRMALAQLGVSALDWLLAAGVLFVLLPQGRVPFLAVLGAFLSAQLLGLVSHVPGGLGVFEGLMVVLLRPFISAGELLPALVVYRAVYYMFPLACALLGLIADELVQRRGGPSRAGAFFGRLTEQLTPRMLAISTFFAGVLLLASGATPAAAGRLAALGEFLPLSVIEASHFIGSLAGGILLILSQGLARRLDAAYVFSAAAIAVGIAASLLKGGDVEEALILAALLAVLWRARRVFDRKAALFETRFSPAWIATVVAALGATVWLGFFSYKHVEYSRYLWWQFELDAEAPRFLRGSVGAAAVVLLFAIGRLIRHAPHEAPPPSDADLEDAGRLIAAQPSTVPLLVYLRDKALLFDEERGAFVMYAVQGRTWVAMGDPVGPADRLANVLRLFLERCDDFGGVPVFYEVRKEHLHRYADFGLTFLKLGEEARVDLSTFRLEGGSGYRARQAYRRLEKEGASLRIVDAGGTAGLMSQLREVSDSWLQAKAGAEKGFSLGFFDAGYLARFPVALVERAGRIVAFANLWPGAGREELSVDLMRYHRDAPKGVMESLLVHLMLWGKAQGYRWFVLGMAPLSGFEHSPVAPLWNRLGAFLYEHGEAVYNFQGLRAYKEKFNPVWEPCYLAYPGGLGLARVLADVAALVAGGYRRIFLK